MTKVEIDEALGGVEVVFQGEYNDLLNAVVKLVADAEGAWIPCKERMPEDDRIVLVWNEDWGATSYAATGRHVDDGTDSGSWHMEDDDEDPEPITHWRPLPKPPEQP